MAIPAADPLANGVVAFFDTDGTPLNAVAVGALPDMLTCTPDGSKVLVANEGEPVTGGVDRRPLIMARYHNLRPSQRAQKGAALAAGAAVWP